MFCPYCKAPDGSACGHTEGISDANVLAVVQSRDHVSFAELESIFGDAARGEKAIFAGPLEANCVIWEGMSPSLLDSVLRLVASNAIVPVRASLLVYACDGRWLGLPIAKTDRVFKKPRWLPCVLRPSDRVARERHRRRSRGDRLVSANG